MNAVIIKLTKEAEIGAGSISASKKRLNGDCATHWHEFYEIEYVLDGHGRCDINSQTFEMKSGMLFFMTPADFHTVKSADATVINIMFSSDMATPSYLAPYTALDVAKAISVTPQTQPFIETILHEIVENKSNRRLCSALIDALLLKSSESFAVFCGDNTYSLSQKMCFYIINHFREKISLEDMANAIGVTPTYASAVFKEQMRTGFKNYLNNMRFDYAKKLLRYSALSVQQICADSGFDDYPNFIRRFKERFGVSPTQYRERKELL